MPPRRASVGAKKKIVKTGRAARKYYAAAAAAAEAGAESPTVDIPAASETAAEETTAAADEVATGFPAPEIRPQAVETLTCETSAAAPDEPAAGETATVSEEVKVTTRSPAPGSPPQAAETPAAAADETTSAAADENPSTVETAADKTIVVLAEANVATGSRAQPADRVPEADAGATAEGEATVGAAADEVCLVEPADTPQIAAETVKTKSVRKITKKVVRKVTRRVPVKKTPNKAEPQAGREEKGDGGGEEAVPLPPSMEGEQDPNGDEAVPIVVAGQNSIGAAAESISVEGQNSNGSEATPISVEELNAVSCPDQSSTPEEPAVHVEAAVSAGAAAASTDGASAVVVPQRRVRKVKKIVLVKRPVKAAKASQKEEKMEEADGGAAEKVDSTVNYGNANESTKKHKPDMEVEATSVPDGSLKMAEDVVPELGKDDSEKGDSGRSVDVEQEKVDGAGTSSGTAGDQVTGMTERQKRRKTEIFIGGLDRDAKEDDIRKVFGKVGEIVEVRMMMDKKSGKNKGYAFLRYATAAQAKQAVTEFTKVEVCGKQCGAAALEGNDTIFLGNIDKKWNKDDVIKLLSEIGIEKIDTVTLMPDPKYPDCNRGFAFLDFETNRDAQSAFKKLQKKDIFGKGQNIKVAWAEPLVDPDEEEMQKVKSVFAEGIPSSWVEKKVRECFKRFGQIERVVLSRNMHSAKRKDFAFVNFTTREAALSCIESFNKDSTDNGSKVNIKVSLAKPVQKIKQNKAGMKSADKGIPKVKPKAVQRESKVNISVKNQPLRVAHGKIVEDKMSTTHELLHVLREQAAWKQIGYPRGPAVPDHSGALHGGKRPVSSLGDDSLYEDPRRYSRARQDSAYPVAGSSYSSLSHSIASTSLEYYQQSTVGYGRGSTYGVADPSRAHQNFTSQVRPRTASYGSGPYSNLYSR